MTILSELRSTVSGQKTLRPWFSKAFSCVVNFMQMSSPMEVNGAIYLLIVKHMLECFVGLNPNEKQATRTNELLIFCFHATNRNTQYYTNDVCCKVITPISKQNISQSFPQDVSQQGLKPPSVLHGFKNIWNQYFAFQRWGGGQQCYIE